MPLSVRSGGPTAAWEPLTGLWAGQVHAHLGCQKESTQAQEQMTAARAPSQLPSPGPLDFLRAPAFC